MTLKNLKYKIRYKNDKIIFVNPTILLDMLEKTSYGVRQPSGQIGNRVQRAKEFILKYWDDPRAQKTPMFEPSVVGIYGSPGHEHVSFSDGRHRVLAAEELGITEVAIEIPRNQEKKFEFMKVKPIQESVLNESPDAIKKLKIHCFKDDALPFACYINNDNSIDIEIGKFKGTHWDLKREHDTYKKSYSGRLWLNEKVISFWLYPNKSIFTTIINFLEIKLDKKIWTNDWKIEILINDSDWSNLIPDNIETDIIPIEDYLKSKDFPDELKQKHIMSWKEKELKKPSKGWGSDKNKPLSWKQALYQESVKKSYYKLNETPDNIKNGVLHDYTWNSGQALPFTCIKDNKELKVFVGDWGQSHRFISNDKDELIDKTDRLYSGRLWVGEKIISFWSYPNKKDFDNIINQLEVHLLKEIKTNISNKIWNNGWKVEIFLYKDEFNINKSYLYFLSKKDGTKNITTKLIPVEKYMESQDFPDELKQKHILSWKEKEELKKPTGWGSDKNRPLDWKQALYQESVNNDEDIKTKFKKDILLPLKRESLKFNKYKDFSDSYSIYGNHGLYFHLTDNSDWNYNSEMGSRDMSSMASGRFEKGSFMVTSDLENWDYHYNFDQNDNPRTSGTRDYVALIDLGDVNYHIGFGRGFGHELYIRPSEAKKLIVLDVLPIKEARKFYKKWKNKRPQSEEQLYKIWKDTHPTEIIITKFGDFENNNII